MIEKIVTLGVYGTNEARFFRALTQAKVDTFCDIRLHRGMRGSTFSYVNSAYLQAKLAEIGIRYLHVKDLAPSKEIRALQKEDDKRRGVEKRTRETLGRVFLEEYRKRNLAGFDADAFMQILPPDAKIIAFFCVEREPEACHRSIVASLLKEKYFLPVEDLKP